jgi:pseudouridine-5'-phosphate glycosidase
MEYPQNYNTAISVEREIREKGAIPATIVILDGKIRIGLTEEEIHQVSKNKSHFEKCTTRDLPYIISQKKSGSTTVAATMYLAKLAGIDVFVTGGIGGVHYGDDWDVSADLTELSRTPIVVVCAGIKSILDINRTLEVLETYSVPVIGLKTDTFPEFFFTEGDHKVKIRLDSHKEIADLFDISIDLGLKSGVLVGVPVPKEESADKELVKDKIKQALYNASQLNIRGPAITPFLLREVNDLSCGKSSEANVALIRNNAIQGALISIELVNIRKKKIEK